MPRPSHYYCFENRSFSSLWSLRHRLYLLPLRPKYFRELPIFSQTQPMFLPQCEWPHKTTGKIIGLYALIFLLWDSKLEHERFCNEWQQAFSDCNLLLISLWTEFLFVRVVLKHFKCSTFSKDLLYIFMLWFCPASWCWNMSMYLVLSVFMSRPLSLLATNKALCFSLWYVFFCPLH